MEGELPPGWLRTKISDVTEILDSQRIPINNAERQARLENANNRYPYYGATGQVGEIDDYIFDGESVLLGEDGAPFLEARKAKAYLATGKYWVNNHAHILRGNGAINLRFLCHSLNIVEYRPFVSGTTRLKLTQASMKDIPISLPPLNEQRRIVEKIETLFAELDKGEEAIRETQKLLKRYRQSVLKAAVTGELTKDWREKNRDRLESGADLLARILKTRREQWSGRGKYKEPVAPDTTGLPELPEGWVWASLGQLVTKIEAGKNVRCLEVSPTGDQTGIVKISAVTWDEFDESESKTITDPSHLNTAALIKEGDLLISRANTLELVGASVVVRRITKKLQLSDKVLRLRCIGPLEDWINYFLKSLWGRVQIEGFATGAQMSMRNISQTNLEKIAVPLPGAPEIELAVLKIHEELEKQKSVYSLCNTELRRSAALRQSILKQAFSGKLVPQDPADEPASELLARIRAERDSAPKAKRGRKRA